MSKGYTKEMGAKLTRVSLEAITKKRVPGIDKGKIWMAEDFDVLSGLELAEWYRAFAAPMEKAAPTRRQPPKPSSYK